MEYSVHTNIPNGVREYAIEFADSTDVVRAWDIVRDYAQGHSSGIFGAMPGLKWTYADEVIKDESNILHVICRPSDMKELKERWEEV